MMTETVVFVSRDEDEFSRYRKGTNKEAENAFSLGMGSCVVCVVKAFPEKDLCVDRHFSDEDVREFLDVITERLKGVKDPVVGTDGRILSRNFRLFVHWGGGAWMDLESDARRGLNACSRWKTDFGIQSRSAFAISSRRPELFDVQANPICLPQSEAALATLIRKAQYEVLSEFWTRCAVFGEMPPRDRDSAGIPDDLVEEFLRDMELSTLNSHLPSDQKKIRQERIRSLIETRKEVLQSKVPVALSDGGRQFLYEILKKEGDCV